MNPNRVIIVGSGVIGLCSAYYALKRGFPVTVVEHEPAGGDNCSMGNAGLVEPSHFTPLASPGMVARGLRMLLRPESPFFLRPRLDRDLWRWAWLFYRHSTERNVLASRELLRDLNLESRRLFLELAETGDFGLQARGLLMLCKTPERLEEEAAIARSAHEVGVQADVLDPAAVAKLDPGVTMDILGAVFYPQDCHMDPARFMAFIRQRVLDLGGEIENGIAIDSIDFSNGRVKAVTGSGRRFEGGKFVISCGSWSAQLLKTIGLNLPLQAGKGYSLTLPSPPELPRVSSLCAEAWVAVTPMGSKLRFAGTMEIGGLDHSITASRVHGIIQSIPAYFPKFSESDFAGTPPWAGLRPVSPDGVPYTGAIRGLPNLFTACGHAMMGLSLGPITGRLIADLLAGDPPFRPIDAMSPGRF
jgi:D-amino-acid dehydrogenase